MPRFPAIKTASVPLPSLISPPTRTHAHTPQLPQKEPCRPTPAPPPNRSMGHPSKSSLLSSPALARFALRRCPCPLPRTSMVCPRQRTPKALDNVRVANKRRDSKRNKEKGGKKLSVLVVFCVQAPPFVLHPCPPSLFFQSPFPRSPSLIHKQPPPPKKQSNV